MANLGDESRGNVFVNDGSFMEMFRQLQEQQKHPLNESTQVEGKEDSVSASNSASNVRDATSHKEPERVVKSNQRTAHLEARDDKDKGKEKEKTGLMEHPPQTKSSQGVMLGKRKSLMKTIELREKRKRRREEMEEQQQQQAQQEDKDKSSAWKAYMAQVKAYEARSCSDEDGHRRPLVK